MQIKMRIKGLEDAKRELRRLADRAERDRAIAAAINKVSEKGRTEVSRAVREEWNIGASDVSASIGLRRASAKGLRLDGAINIYGSPKRRGRSLNLVRFMEKKVTLAEGRRRAKRGDLMKLFFRMRKGGGLKGVAGAFLGNKGRTVFRRTGKGRLPIEPVQMIGVSQMFNSRAIRDRVMRRIENEFGIEIHRAVEMVIARRMK
jgi:hypothetical protein